MNQTDDDLTLHEFTHAVSSQQTDAQKKIFTEVFLKGCPKAKTLKKNEVLEEPLAVALGQMLYLDTYHPIRYQTTKSWYAGKWVGELAKQIYPLVKSYYSNRRKKDSEFIESIAVICKQSLN